MAICGRPTKLTPQTVRIICQELRRGATRREAAATAGISCSTLYAWMRDGRENAAGYYAFFRRVRDAETCYWRQYDARREAASGARKAALEFIERLRG
jgi:hypothetical protein